MQICHNPQDAKIQRKKWEVQIQFLEIMFVKTTKHAFEIDLIMIVIGHSTNVSQITKPWPRNLHENIDSKTHFEEFRNTFLRSKSKFIWCFEKRWHYSQTFDSTWLLMNAACSSTTAENEWNLFIIWEIIDAFEHGTLSHDDGQVVLVVQ